MQNGSGREVVIVEAVRTPIGRGHPEKGYYKNTHPNELLGKCYSEVIERAGIPAEEVEDVITGCVQQYGEQMFNVGRNAWLQAGLPVETPATTEAQDLPSGPEEDHHASGDRTNAPDITIPWTGAIPVSMKGIHVPVHNTPLTPSRREAVLIAIAKAKSASGLAISDVRYAAVYDSFTITLAMLLEDLGLAGRGEAAARVRAGHFGREGVMPLNTHGGLLSYGHCGVGGAMAHLVETHLQMTGRAGGRQVRDASIALLHGDGGVLSSHVSMFLERVR